MKKLLQMTLVSAILATSGFASEELVVENSGTFNIAKYPSGIDVNVTVKDTGTMNITDDLTLNAGKTITLEKGATGSITAEKALTNKGQIVMNYEAGKTTGLFPAGAGSIVQNYGTVTQQGSILANLDNTKVKTWYIYNYAGDYLCNETPNLTNSGSTGKWIDLAFSCGGFYTTYDIVDDIKPLNGYSNLNDIKTNFGGYVSMFKKAGSQVSINADLDGNGAADWYLYWYAMSPVMLYSKASGLTAWTGEDSDWYYNDTLDITRTDLLVEGRQGEYSLINQDVDIYEVSVPAVDSTIQINGVDKIAYYSSAGSTLGTDTTPLTGSLGGKTAKKITTGTAGFNPNIPGAIASISYTDTQTEPVTHTLGGDTSGIDSQETLDSYFASFGISFKQADGNTASTTEYGAGQSVIDAIAGGTIADAILIGNEEIDVSSDAKTIAANLHNIDVTGAAPSFSGAGTLTLSGDNSLLSNATLNCPVKISGANALPTSATFKSTLDIAEDVEIGTGSAVTVKGKLSIENGNTLTISGGTLTLGGDA